MSAFDCRRALMIPLIALIALLPLRADAQSTTAKLTGRIVDESHALVAGVEVTVVDIVTGLEQKTQTDDRGEFVLALLPPARYQLTALREGFAPLQVPEIVLNVNDRIALALTLTVATVGESVTVESTPSRVNTSPAVSTVIDRRFVESLPLNGRSFQSLILLTPGVTVASSGGNDYGQFSVNGQRASANYFTVDGVSANIGVGQTTSVAATNAALGGAYPGLSVFGGTNNLISVDALEAYQIQTSTYAAEFGRQPGGQISLVTRSGTNQWHGSIADYVRNDALDATDWFVTAKGLVKPPLRQQQFAGTLGGPVLKNRSFFFFSYEGQRLRLPVSGTTYVPSLRLRAAAADVLKPFLASFPQPTGPELLTATGQPSGLALRDYSVSNPGTLDATSVRSDYHVSRRLTVFGRFNDSPSDTTTNTGGAYATTDTATTRTLTVGATAALTPHMSNELRINDSRQDGLRQYSRSTDGGAIPVDLALLTNGLGGYGSIALRLNGQLVQGYGGDNTRNHQQQFNLVDNLSIVAGAHQLKFGLDYRRLAPIYGTQDTQSVIFTSEASVLSATADNASVYTLRASRPRFTSLSVYAQDTWVAGSRLTLDAGLRWELNPPPSEADGTMPPIAHGIVGHDVSRATLAPPGTPFYQTDYAAFAPRLGAAYRLIATPGRETVLRGGVGLYYDLGSAAATTGFPLRSSTTRIGVPFPLSATDAARPPVAVPTALPITTTVYSSDEHLTLPRTWQWNVAMERSVGTRESVSVSYVGAAGRRLLTTQFLNGTASPSLPRPNPDFASIQYTWNGSSSDYHALQVQYKARPTRDLQALVNYTWSHAIDDDSSDLATYILIRGNANYDVRHNLSAALAYNLPAPPAPLLAAIFGHWSLDATIHAQSGRPLDVTGNITTYTATVDGIFSTIRPDLVPGEPVYISDPSVPGGRRFNAAAFTAPPMDPTYRTPLRQGTFGRNVLRELPLYQVDLALGRRVTLVKGWALQLKGELFNVFNHPMFGSYGRDFSTPATFGVPAAMLRSSLSSSVSGLNALYQMGGPRSVQLSARFSF